MTDAEEIGVTDPLNDDSDADGIIDGDEVFQNDPVDSDSDDDGINDGDEVQEVQIHLMMTSCRRNQ